MARLCSDNTVGVSVEDDWPYHINYNQGSRFLKFSQIGSNNIILNQMGFLINPEVADEYWWLIDSNSYGMFEPMISVVCSVSWAMWDGLYGPGPWWDDYTGSEITDTSTVCLTNTYLFTTTIYDAYQMHDNVKFYHFGETKKCELPCTLYSSNLKLHHMNNKIEFTCEEFEKEIKISKLQILDWDDNLINDDSIIIQLSSGDSWSDMSYMRGSIKKFYYKPDKNLKYQWVNSKNYPVTDRDILKKWNLIHINSKNRPFKVIINP